MKSEQASLSILEFCIDEGISRASYYNMLPENRPREYLVGRLKRISPEARAEWRQRQERKYADSVSAA